MNHTAGVESGTGWAGTASTHDDCPAADGPGLYGPDDWRTRVVDAPVTETGSIESVRTSLRGESAAFAVQLDDEAASVEAPVGLPDGTYCDVVVPDCASVVEVSGGVAALELGPWQAAALDRFPRP